VYRDIIALRHHTSNATNGLPINHHTPVRMQALPTNQTTILTRQEHKTSSNLTRLSRPPHRRCTELILRILLHRARDQWRPHRPWANSIYANAVGDLLVVQAASEADDGAFGAGVVEKVGAPDVGVYGGAVYDCVAGFHVGEGVFGEVEVGVDVCVEGFEPLVSVRVAALAMLGFVKGDGRRVRREDVLRELSNAVNHVLVCGVIDQDVDRPHLVQSLLYQLLAILHLAHVSREKVAFPPVLLDRLLGLLSIFLLVWQICNDAVGTLHSVEDRNCPPDARVTTGDDGFFALELAGRFVGLVAAIFGGDFFVGGVGTFHVGLVGGLGHVLDGDLVAWYCL